MIQYLYKNKHYIIIHPKLSSFDKIDLALCEYGECENTSKATIAKIYEYGKLLLSE